MCLFRREKMKTTLGFIIFNTCKQMPCVSPLISSSLRSIKIIRFCANRDNQICYFAKFHIIFLKFVHEGLTFVAHQGSFRHVLRGFACYGFSLVPFRHVIALVPSINFLSWLHSKHKIIPKAHPKL